MGRGSRGRAALAATVTVLASGLAASAAPAGVLQAEGVLPPGQSGFVSLAGLTSGTGSPHLYDQNQMYIDFRRKPLLFQIDRPVGAVETPRPGVTIARDAAGVPAVRAGNEADAWFGAGYAIAQDRLFQLEAFRHATKGRLAELTGSGALADDLVSRRDYYTESERQRMYERLSPRLKTRILAYRDGINAWIDRVRLSPADLPAEYVATATLPTPWTVDDSIAVGIFLARTVPSGDGNELANLRTVQQSGVRALQQLLPLRTTGRRPTIPAADADFSQGRARTAREERDALRRSAAFAQTLPRPSAAAAAAPARKAGLAPGRIGRTGGSYMFAVRRKDGHAFLFNGPQLGFSTPELFVEVEVHWPGHDLRGVTAPGIPVIGIGHNGKVAWGFTSGLSDEDDLYAEKLVPGKPETYIYKGQERQMECRDETFQFKNLAAAVLGGGLPEAGQRTERICRTVHGPVQHREGDVAYARRYAIWMRDVETLEGIVALNDAASIHDVDRAMNLVTWNENVMAADSQGNIGYWHPGLFQQRPKGWDDRLPYPGTGEAEWPGLVDRTRTPRVINPKQGWLANWNNVPTRSWTNGDGESPERVSGAFHRGSFLMDLVRRLHRAPDFEAAKATVQRAGSTAQQRVLAVTRTRLRAAARGATGDAKVVLDTILRWDGDYVRTDARGTIDPGVATWLELKRRAAAIALGRLGDGVKRFDGTPSRSHEYDISPGAAYALRTLKPAELRTAAAAAHAALAERFGTADASAWRDPRKLYDVGAQGAGSAPDLPFFDRGTWEQVIELGP
ncbi:hypothetical protein GKE82_06385 [Conexibacter sp. W3-3-2]|uniref:penicillin acylase family protein n=1 Tax=Conexibacter sp. W3-3-2 TaxID=2675227 RepID=UPI0012B73AE1|nr:penicillin acylase family protein [Conexibacter sp. W3-3-2]MTD43940.1 hypothetical protein [Conexibacter sp. W3-3-2]